MSDITKTVYSSLPPFSEMMELLEVMEQDAKKSYNPDCTVSDYTYKCMQKEYSEEQMKAIDEFLNTNKFFVVPEKFSLFNVFAPVHHPHYKDWEMPRRATELSAGYDLRTPCDIVVPSDKPVLVFTGVKWCPSMSFVDELRTKGLVPWVGLHIRSSLAKKIYLVNNVGVIDADYENNPDTNGDMGLLLQAYDEPVEIPRGTRIAQAIIYSAHKVAMDVPVTSKPRTGGFGSTGKK